MATFFLPTQGSKKFERGYSVAQNGLRKETGLVKPHYNYRELAEKHTTLLRRYSKESKVNKQLSMNNEELMWKLEQVAFAPTASPNPIRRTHSGPSTKSATGTPLAARRSQPEMQWESFSSEGGGVLPGTEDSDLDSAIME